jgi:hypothetical protein
VTITDLVPWQCDVCGDMFDIEPHCPHHPACDHVDECECDYVVCPDCCWASECTEGGGDG